MAAADRKRTGDEHVATWLAFPPDVGETASVRYTPGSLLSDKYRLDALLGEGGMGEVWRATNLLLDSPVAIKLIRADLDRSAFRERLQLEARAAARLGHPAIVRVFDVGESDLGDPFIVMELLQGETLEQMLTRGRLTAIEAVQLLLPIVDALGAAHARGIVHRDLKPGNLLIASEDQRVQPKVVDFGIAKLVDPRDENRKLTEIGTLVGSPDYMSPEQARGMEDVDYRTDIWAMCVVLYEAITGQAPFNGSTYNALLRSIIEDEPPSLMQHSAGDAPLWEILRIGLSKDRLARQSSMSKLGRALALWLISHGVNEDACGTSLESKWFGSAAGPPNAQESGGAARPAYSSSSGQKPNHHSGPKRDPADSRRSFAATIRPKAGHRKSTVGAAIAACALVGTVALAFTLLPSTRVSATALAVVHSGTAKERNVSNPPPKEAAVERLADPAASLPAFIPVTPQPARADTHPQLGGARQKSRAATAHPSEPRVAHADAPVRAPSRPPSAPTSSSDLDLLAPY